MFNNINTFSLPGKALPAVCFLLFGFSLLFCKDQGRNAETQIYKLGLHLKAGSKYYYTINNKTETRLEVNGKKTENSNTSQVGLLYEILSDTAGGFLLRITYDSFHIVTKSGDTETEMDAANAAFSLNPAERLLAGLKGSSLLVQINNKGEVLVVSGYKEIADKLMANIKITTEMERQQVQTQLYEMLGEGFVKNNLAQGLNLFPDSALHTGDSWVKKSSQTSALKLDVTNRYTLNDVENNIAEIKSASEITSSNSAVNLMSVETRADLKGDGESTYKIDLETGMLLIEKSVISIEGNVEMMQKRNTL